MMNKNAIEELFKTHYGQMCRLATALLHDDDLARDIVHDVFATLLDKDSPNLFNKSYLLTAVRNRCLNHIRALEIHQRISNLYFIDNEEYETESWPDDETISLISKLINNDIPPQARRVMELRFSEGLPFALIASTMGISETAVYRHLKNALTIIRNKLKENE